MAITNVIKFQCLDTFPFSYYISLTSDSSITRSKVLLQFQQLIKKPKIMEIFKFFTIFIVLLSLSFTFGCDKSFSCLECIQSKCKYVKVRSGFTCTKKVISRMRPLEIYDKATQCTALTSTGLAATESAQSEYVLKR